jgi:hypothetical protein
MVTSSTSSEDRQKAFDLGVREYHIKGSDWKEFLTPSKSICELVSQLADAKHRAADQGGKHVDYCLNILGIRVRDKNCCLIAKLGNAWSPLGPISNLPVSIPSTPLEVQIAGNDPLRLPHGSTSRNIRRQTCEMAFAGKSFSLTRNSVGSRL